MKCLIPVSTVLVSLGLTSLPACDTILEGPNPDPDAQADDCLLRIAAKQNACQVPPDLAEPFRKDWCDASTSADQTSCFESKTCPELMGVILPGGFPCIAPPDQISLADGFQPEGIVKGPGTLAYVGTLTRGGIQQVDLRSGKSSFLVDPKPAGERVIAGLAYDGANHQIVACGAWMANGFIFDAATGAELDAIEFPQGSMINSVDLREQTAFFTDSANAVFYRLPMTDAGLPAGPVETIDLVGDFQMVASSEAANANGIVAIPGSPYLLIVNSLNGRLYRVDPGTGDALAIAVGDLPYGDGLLLVDGQLYVIQGGPVAQVSVLSLNTDFTAASVSQVIGNSRWVAPTTAAKLGPSLWVVSSRLTVIPHGAAAPDDAFELVRVDPPVQ